MKNLFSRIFIFVIVIISGCATQQNTDATETVALVETSDIESDSPAEFLDSASDTSEDTDKVLESIKSDQDFSTDTDKFEEIDYQAVKPYEVGRIMIIMYHGIVGSDTVPDAYQRTVSEFKNDLKTLYDEGFRLVSLRDYVNNDIKVEAGKSPVILTFDDGISTSFSLVSNNGTLVPRPDCAVDIINKFCEEYPDFGKAAVFFINKNPFPGDGSLKDAFSYLAENGYEIGNHTLSHKDMSKLTAEEIVAEVGSVEKIIQENLPGYETCALSYPYGIRPQEDDLQNLCLNGSFDGITYNYKIGLREGQSTSHSAPNRINYDPTNVPRVRGSDNAETDFGWTLRSFRENPDLKYVSDGNPNRISIPEEYKENINYESLGDKELFIYERIIDK